MKNFDSFQREKLPEDQATKHSYRFYDKFRKTNVTSERIIKRYEFSFRLNKKDFPTG